MSNSAVLNSLIHTKTQPRKIPLTVSPYSLVHTQKTTGFNTTRKRCQIPLFLTVWFTQRLSPDKSHSQRTVWFTHKKTGINTASRKWCQIPLFLTVWFTQRFSRGKSHSQCCLTVWFTHKKTGFNSASRKWCQIPLFLTVWSTQRFSPGKSRSVSPHSLIHTKTQSRKIPLSVASQSDSHKSQRRKLDRQAPTPTPTPAPRP